MLTALYFTLVCHLPKDHLKTIIEKYFCTIRIPSVFKVLFQSQLDKVCSLIELLLIITIVLRWWSIISLSSVNLAIKVTMCFIICLCLHIFLVHLIRNLKNCQEILQKRKPFKGGKIVVELGSPCCRQAPMIQTGEKMNKVIIKKKQKNITNEKSERTIKIQF